MVSTSVTAVDRVLDVLWRNSEAGQEDESQIDKFAEITLDNCGDYEILFALTKRQRQCAWSKALKQWESVFGFRATAEEWSEVAGPKTTMRKLATFIAARADLREVRPVELFGRRCLEAGVFRELERATAWITGLEERIGPSTRLRSALRHRQLRQFASRLRALFPWVTSSNGQLWNAHVLYRIGWGSLSAATLGMAITEVLGWIGERFDASVFVGLVGAALFATVLSALAAMIFLPAGLIWGSIQGPFRLRIRTFRDVVEAIAPHLESEPSAGGASRIAAP